MIDTSVLTQPLEKVYHRVGRPYLRAFHQSLVINQSRIHWVTCSPLISHIFSKAECWYIDCTFNEMHERGEILYLMNIVTYVEELNRRKSFLRCDQH